MDEKLVSWARAVKARRDRGRSRQARAIPVLFFFTDRRVVDPAAVVRRLRRCRAARTLFGVVVRGDRAGQHRLLQALRPICRASGIALLVAGDARLAAAAGVGLHLPGGRRTRVRARPGALVSGSAHGRVELGRVRAAGCAICFVSPVFATASHPGARPLGPVRLARLLGRGARPGAIALGGVDGARARALPRGVAGAAAIDAFVGP